MSGDIGDTDVVGTSGDDSVTGHSKAADGVREPDHDVFPNIENDGSFERGW